MSSESVGTFRNKLSSTISIPQYSRRPYSINVILILFFECLQLLLSINACIIIIIDAIIILVGCENRGPTRRIGIRQDKNVNDSFITSWDVRKLNNY